MEQYTDIQQKGVRMRKSVYTLLRFSLLGIGFSLVCLGAFFVSSSSNSNSQNETIVAYTIMPLGFLLLLCGIFWSTYHEANHKSLFQYMIRRIHSQQQVQIETIDRPDFYPPSYERALHDAVLNTSTSVQIYLEEPGFNIPPPLYTETAMDIVDETYLSEDPPPSYEMSVQTPSSGAEAEASSECAPETVTALETNETND
ncbi:transmembrane protein 252 [Hyperolius riggenbachi]|uniref:transmembrane protein 252 n=1 Tax=Hyperolius riggenbachi TaxID=752182 RepID=UPI0035A377A9